MKRYIFPVCLLVVCLLLCSACTQTPAREKPTTNQTSSSTTKNPSKTTSALPSAETTTGTSSKKETHTTAFSSADFHTDILMTLDKAEYAPDEKITVTITNNKERKISYGPGYIILKPDDGNTWQMLQHAIGTPLVLYNQGAGSSRTDVVNLAKYAVEANQSYRLALKIGEKWVTADFRTTA